MSVGNDIDLTTPSQKNEKKPKHATINDNKKDGMYKFVKYKPNFTKMIFDQLNIFCLV